MTLVCVRSPQDRMLELHIRSLRTNKSHALAKSPVLTHKLAGGPLRYSHIMQTCQDRVAILHSGTFEPEIWHEKFVVYNWKTGVKEMVRGVSEIVNDLASDFRLRNSNSAASRPSASSPNDTFFSPSSPSSSSQLASEISSHDF